MVGYLSSETSELKSDIDGIEIPECPECPACPGCPSCPQMIVNEKEQGDIKEKINLECPKCPECPDCESGQYPTVEDIVGGIFPGRNMGLTRGGIYKEVSPAGSYELLPEYDFYRPEDAFPKDTILSRAIGEIEEDRIQFDNSFDNSNVDTRMNMGLNNLEKGNLQNLVNRKNEEELQVPVDEEGGLVEAVAVDETVEEDIPIATVVSGG